MQRILGLKKDEELGQNPQGKPFMKKGGVHFNLTHAGEFVAMAVDTQPVGVDVERIGHADSEVAQRCFQEDEQAYVFGGGDPDERFFPYGHARKA